MPTALREVVISNRQGLHARPAMVFAELAGQFQSTIRVARPNFMDDPCEVDGKSLIQMISLEATAGAKLRIRAEGEDAETAVAELAKLVESGFGED